MPLQVKSVVLQKELKEMFDTFVYIHVLGMSWMFEVPTVRLKVRSPCPSLTL